MAHIVGSRNLRVNIKRLWRNLEKPTDTWTKRETYIAKIRAELDIDRFLRHSTRLIAHGDKMYWQIPHFVFNAKRNEILASPELVGFDIFDRYGDPKDATVNPEHEPMIEKLRAELQVDEELELEKSEDGEVNQF